MNGLIDACGLRCVKCGAESGACECWEDCQCGWRHEKGAACRNPLHAVELAAKEMADDVAAAVLGEMAPLYPEPMRHASGGFCRTLKVVMCREITDALVHWMMAVKDAERDAP